MADLLFDTPWWLLVLLIGAGATIFLAGNRRQERHVMRIGLILLLVGGGIAAVGYFVETDKERAVRQTRAIARAVSDQDWDRLATHLDPNTTLMFYRNRDEIIAGGSQTAERIGLKNVRVTSVRPDQTDTLITVDVDVLSEQDLFPSTPTSWRFHYENLGSGWRLSRIEALPNRIITPDVIQQQLSRPRG
jgi:hypothetical protein